MKNFCVLHILLLVLLMLVYQCTKAQDLFVSLQGDTVRGEVKQFTFGPEKKVQVMGADKKKVTYSILQTRSFVDNGETFQPVRGPRGYVFMKLIKPGYLSLLKYQPENQTTYDGDYLLKRDGSGMEVPNLTFKKLMSRFLTDCPGVSVKIENGDLGKRDLETIVDEYNACIEKNTAVIDKALAQNKEQVKKISAWDVLEDKVKSKPDFESKADALEMISDIKGKIRRSEKIPNFLLEGLKSSLAQAGLSVELQNALNEINP